MPFQEGCSHPLPDRHLGDLPCARTRTCLWPLVLASRANGLRPLHLNPAGTKGREDRERITSPSSMAAATTLTTPKRLRTPSRTTRSLLACECSLPSFHHRVGRVRAPVCEGRGSGEGNPKLIPWRDRDLLDHAFLRSVSRTSAVNFRVPPTKVLELGCGVRLPVSLCFFFFLSGAAVRCL